MDVFVPFDATDPKTRLDPVLTAEERATFARQMLRDVIGAIEGAGGDPTVVATKPIPVPCRVAVDDRSLGDAVNARLESTSCPVAVVMADLPLASAETLDRLFGADGEVVLAPGRGGGTNAIVSRHPAFRVDYHGASIRDHRAIAGEIGATVGEVDSRRLATDIDEPADLAEVLLDGDGLAAEWLCDRGFELAVGDGRVSVER